MLRPGVPVVIVAVFVFGWQLRCYLVLPASQFQHILNDSGRTCKAYEGHAGHELSLLSPKRRGMILAEFSKKQLAQLHPHATIEEPTRQNPCNGPHGSASQAGYHFSVDGRKIVCRSAQMTWRRSEKLWIAHFRGVKLQWPYVRNRAPFDDLYLTIFSPDSLHVIKHDLQTGVSSNGLRTGRDGHYIRVQGVRGQECWQTARSQILDKFLASSQCELVAHIDLSATEVHSWFQKQLEGMAALQDHEYKGVPLNHMTPELRGLRIEQIAFEVDQILHPNCSFSRASSKVDWVRGGVKVESKHGQMRFNKGCKSWQCTFSNIQCASSGVRARDMFDELWLAIYSPLGIHILKHPGGKVHFSRTGAKDIDKGREIHVFSGNKCTVDVKEALDNMLRKMEAWGCKPLATIHW